MQMQMQLWAAINIGDGAWIYYCTYVLALHTLYNLDFAIRYHYNYTPEPEHRS